MNVACDYEAPMQMLTTEKYIAAGPEEYRVPKCDVIKFSFFAFQHFHDNISVEHNEKPSHTKLT